MQAESHQTDTAPREIVITPEMVKAQTGEG